MHNYVLLDRDGVINEDSDSYIKTPNEWCAIPGSLEAIALLNKHGYKIVVITNQSGIARNYFDIETLNQIHAKMHHCVEKRGGKIDAIYICPHLPIDKCICRKPKPGLLNRFSQEMSVQLINIPFIGDSLKDIQAANSVGAKPILVKTGKGKQTLIDNPGLNIPVFEDLYAAANFILSR